jgi:hypothetical protein
VAAPAFLTATAEMLGAAAVYDPQGMMQVGNDLAQLPTALGQVAETLRIMTQRSHDQDPIDPAIIAKMGDIYKMLSAAAQASEDLGPMFRKMHHVEIHRIENPRKGEHKWDISANR